MTKIHSQIKSAIAASSHILLHLHPHPDADSAGSALAFYHFLKSLKKKVTLISGDNNLPANLQSLPGSNKITPKNFFQIDLSKYDLFIILDSSAPDQISKIAPVVFPPHLKTIVIDHHASNQAYGNLNLIDKNSPATCQVVYELFKKLKAKITPAIAACLLAGLHTDTGGYKYPPTTASTFTAAAELSQIYPKFTKIIFEIENNDTPDNLKFLGLILNHIETHFSDHVAIASLSFEEIKNSGLNPDQIPSGISNMLKSVVGWEIGISMIESQPNKVDVSMRTRDSHKYDLSQITVATGFGGGHKAAAGATIPLSLSNAKKLVLECIQKLHPDL